jgi:hypothetical protein
MDWFRSNGVAWLPLFALRAAYVVIRSRKFDDRPLAFAALETGNAAAAGPPSPPQKKSNGLAVDFCDICEHQPRQHAYSADSGNHPSAAFVRRGIVVAIDGHSSRLT